MDVMCRWRDQAPRDAAIFTDWPGIARGVPGSAGIYLPAADNKTDIYLPVADNKIDIARMNNRGPSAHCGQDARAPRGGASRFGA